MQRWLPFLTILAFACLALTVVLHVAVLIDPQSPLGLLMCPLFVLVFPLQGAAIAAAWRVVVPASDPEKRRKWAYDSTKFWKRALAGLRTWERKLGWGIFAYCVIGAGWRMFEGQGTGASDGGDDGMQFVLLFSNVGLCFFLAHSGILLSAWRLRSQSQSSGAGAP